MPAFQQVRTAKPLGSLEFKYHGDPFIQCHLSSLEPLHAENVEETVNTIPVNITEDDESLMIVCEVPGLSRDSIELCWEKKDVLVISFEKTPVLDMSMMMPLKKSSAKIHCNELVSGKMRRVIKLSSKIDTSTIQAEMKQGILTISLKKIPENQKKVINVQIT